VSIEEEGKHIRGSKQGAKESYIQLKMLVADYDCSCKLLKKESC